MKESFLVSFLVFFANVNDYFPESNDFNKNSLIDYNIYIDTSRNWEISEIYYLNKLYNDYGINYKYPIEIGSMSNIHHITNISQKYEIQMNSFIIITNKEILTKIIDELISDDFFNPLDSIVILVKEELFNYLSSEEVKKYKTFKNCFLITFSGNSLLDKLIEIKDNTTEIYNLELHIDITYSEYPYTKYMIFACLFLISTNVVAILFCYKYKKINNQDKLGIHFLIFICFMLVNICYIFVLIEIKISEQYLLYKLISKGYFVNKILKTIFYCISKNMIMWIFFLISRAYCILFFDNQYKYKYIKNIIIMCLLDYLLQIICKITDSVSIRYIYNIVYYIFIGFYIYYRGRNISIGLLYLLYIIEHDNVRVRTQEELNNIKQVIIEKIELRQKSIFRCYFFCIFGILTPLIYELFSESNGNTYDITVLFQLSFVVISFSRIFYPKKLLQNFTITYEQLINGIPEEFLNEYLYRFKQENYLKKEHFSTIKQNESPIIIINPFQILKNGIYNNYSLIENDNIDKNEVIKDKEIKIINSFSEKGQLGFLINDN